MSYNLGNKSLMAVLGFASLIALGLAWAFRLEPIGKQGFGLGYYRNRWTGTMYCQEGDRLETSAGREKRLARERAENAARLEQARLQREKEGKAATEEAIIRAKADWLKQTERILRGELLYYRTSDGLRAIVPPGEEKEFLDSARNDGIRVDRVTLWQAGKYGERLFLFTQEEGKCIDVPESCKTEFLEQAQKNGQNYWRKYEPRKGEITIYYEMSDNRLFTVAESDENEFLAEAKARNCRVWKK